MALNAKQFIVLVLISILAAQILAITMGPSSHNNNSESVSEKESIQFSSSLGAVVIRHQGVIVDSVQNSSYFSSLSGVKRVEPFGLGKLLLVPTPSYDIRKLAEETNSSLFSVVISLDQSVSNGGKTFEVVPRKIPIAIGMFIPVGSRISISSSFQTSGDTAFIIPTSLVLDVEKKTVPMNGTVDFKGYVYSIPWENRSSPIGDFVSLSISDVVFFNESRPVESLLGLKKDYVVSLDTKKITVSENFTNKSKIVSDFGDGLLFPNSTGISLNNSLPYALSGYAYSVSFDSLGSFDFVSDSKIDKNESGFLVDAIVSGDTVVSIEKVVSKE